MMQHVSAATASGAPLAASSAASVPPQVAPTVPAAGKPPVTGYTVPFSIWDLNGAPVVHARINGKRDADFAVSTGNDNGVILASTADALGLKRNAVKATGKDASNLECVTIDRLDIGGGFAVTGKFGLVDSLPKSPMGVQIEGMLGSDALSDQAVLFDFERNLMIVLLNGNLNDTQLRYLRVEGGAKSGISATLDDPIGYILDVPIHVIGINKKEQNEKLTVKTAEPFTSLASGAAKPVGKPLAILRRHRLNGGVVNEESYSVDLLQVGTGVESHATSALAPSFCDFLAPGDPADYDALGMDFLSQFRVLIDYPARKLYLTPIPRDRTDVFPTEASQVNAQRTLEDMTIRPSAKGRWSIVAIDTTSSTHVMLSAGAHVGDILLDINDVGDDGLNPSELISLIRANHGHLRFTLLRDGRQIAVPIP